MKNDGEEEMYNYKCFGRSTAGEKKSLIKTWMAQVCHRREDDKDQKVLNQRNIDKMIMR